MGLWRILKEGLKKEFKLFVNKDIDLIEQFFVTLSGDFEKIKVAKKIIINETDEIVASEKISDAEQKLYEKVQSLFANDERSWRKAYSIEQLLIPLYSNDKLDSELKRRLCEVERVLDRNVKDCYLINDSNADLSEIKLEKKQAVLCRLVNDLQWHYETRETHRRYKKAARRSVGLVFFVAFFVFFLPDLFPDLLGGIEQMTKKYLVYTSISAGLLGAMFSMLIGLKHRLEQSSIEQLKATSGVLFALTRGMIGMGAGLILFYFIGSDILEELFSSTVTSALFPEFEFDQNHVASSFDYYHTNLAKLTIWCFIAGFSETLVPSMINSAEEKLKKKEVKAAE